ncbi:hypothetical protein [Methylibium sp.]|uniref:hypothetical protein n=1 Tax=Methylibium sp. TaxID=2067992 RepID=UPI003D0F7A38
MRHMLLDTPWAFGLVVVSGFAGILGSFLCFLVFRSATAAKAEKLLSREFFYTGFLTGVAERFFFTLLIGLLGTNGIAQAAVGWVAIKGQVHYKMFSDGSKVDMSRAYLGMLGSLSSLVFAIVGGYVWKEGFSAQKVCEWLGSVF